MWNKLRARGVELNKRFCIKCKTKKNISNFPKHQKYNKSRICFICLGELKCRTCHTVKKYSDFIEKYNDSRKAKDECWNCFIERKKLKANQRRKVRKEEGTLRLPNLSLSQKIWAKISNKKSNKFINTKKRSQKISERSTKVEITSTEFHNWFKINYK